MSKSSQSEPVKRQRTRDQSTGHSPASVCCCCLSERAWPCGRGACGRSASSHWSHAAGLRKMSTLVCAAAAKASPAVSPVQS
eukprot:3897297-Rhodomonas_salina.1